MKVSVTIEPNIAKAIAARYDLSKLQNSLDADYNAQKVKSDDDNLAITKSEAGIKSANANEKKNLFKSKDSIAFEREGKVNDPRRMTAWLTNWAAFVKRNGLPSGPITCDVLPANLVLWLEVKFLLPAIAAKEKAAADAKAAKGKTGNRKPKASKDKGNHRNGNIETVPTAPAA